MARETRLQLEVDATPEQVWKAISEAEEIQKWFAPIAKVEPGKGGTMFVSWGPGAEGTAQIQEWEPGKRLSLTMPASPATLRKLEEAGLPKTDLIVDYYIETKDGKTLLTFVHHGFGEDSAWDGELESTNIGWKVFLHNLRHIVSHHRDAKITGVMHGAMTRLPDPLAAWNRAATALFGEQVRTGVYADGSVEYAEPGKCLLVRVNSLNNALLGISVMNARGVAMVVWGGILADMTPEQSEAVRQKYAATLDQAFAGPETT